MTTKSKRIGRRMRQAADYVARHPGCAILPVAECVGPHGSRKYGHEIVHRAIRAGLLRWESGRGNSYALFIPIDGGEKA